MELPEWLSGEKNEINLKIPDLPEGGDEGNEEITTENLSSYEKLMVPEHRRVNVIYDDFKKWGEIGYSNKQPRVEKEIRKYLDIKEAPRHGIVTDLYEFDWERDVKDDATIVVNGRRGSGKSTLIDNGLFYIKERHRFAVVITGTKHNGFWQKRFPAEQIHGVEYMKVVLQNLILRQETIIQHPELGIDPRCVLILDDIMHMVEVVRNLPELRTMFTNGRHLKILTIVLIQDPKGVPPILRECTDVAIIFKMATGPRKKEVIDMYVDVFDDRQYAQLMLDYHTSRVFPNGKIYDEAKDPRKDIRDQTVPKALVCIKGDPSTNVYSLFKSVTAEEIPEYVFGDRDYWEAMLTGDWNDMFDVI